MPFVLGCEECGRSLSVRNASHNTTQGIMQHADASRTKSGETYNGHLVACDDWMNIHLKEVICTSKDGDRFWKMPECYIRGGIIKYLRIPDDVIDKVKEDMQVSRMRNRNQGGGEGGGRGGGARNKFRGAHRGGGPGQRADRIGSGGHRGGHKDM